MAGVEGDCKFIVRVNNFKVINPNLLISLLSIYLFYYLYYLTVIFK